MKTMEDVKMVVVDILSHSAVVAKISWIVHKIYTICKTVHICDGAQKPPSP